jgi:hypothetical protein
MARIVTESFQLNNSIGISKKITKIPLFFNYFNPIQEFKNLDENYNIISNSDYTNATANKYVKYKQILLYSSDNTSFNFDNNFPKSLFHTFISVNLLLKHNICFIIYLNPFVKYNEFPLLNNFSYSLDFKKITANNIKSYFSLQILQNPYIPIDIYLISYIIHNNISIFDKTNFNLAINYYCKHRNIMNINTIVNSIDEFVNENIDNIVNKLIKFKNTWGIFGVISFFLYNYKPLLIKYKLKNLFEEYIQQIPKERNENIIKNINSILFAN